MTIYNLMLDTETLPVLPGHEAVN